jgi:Fe-S cluster assembly protein SufD
MPDTTTAPGESAVPTTRDERTVDHAALAGAVPGATVDTSASFGPGGDVRPQPRAHSHGGPVVPAASRAARRTSFDPADFPVPTGREEEWRFTPVAVVEELFSPDGGAGAGEVSVTAPDPVRWEVAERDDPRLGRVLRPGDRAAAVSYARATRPVLVTVPADAQLSEPVTITLRGTGGRFDGHVALDVGAHANAVVVLDHVGSAMHGGTVEVTVGDGAHVTVVSLQGFDDDSLHLGQHDALVGRDATFRHIAVTLGGKVVRLSTNVRFSGPGGDATLLGLYFADAGQHLEHRLFVDHEAPHCRSNVAYKGALQGETARTVWIGDVLIRAAAEGTDTYELNRNLVLTDGARADSVPNLEIETGQIEGAGHASATGRFDDEQLFYLQARGIPADQARRLVVRGFFAGLVQQIGLPDLQARIMDQVEAELARSMP